MNGTMGSTLGMKPTPLSIMFMDIVGFTSLCETADPDELTQVVDTFFHQMVVAIHLAHGTVDKFIGDCIMAFWGAPDVDDNHPTSALNGALECQRHLQVEQTIWKKEGLPVLDSRTGIMSGVARVGNFGCQQRMNYTCVGDVVNVASRLEGLNKFFGTSIIAGEATVQECGLVLTRFLGDVQVQGRVAPTRVYEVIGWHSECSEEQIAAADLYSNAIHEYQAKMFQEAMAKLLRYPHQADPACRQMLKLCLSCMDFLPSGWVPYLSVDK
eukprot:NODE_750_length_1894_cov_27.386531_g697_i0.p2 GENE.NODE_750_length_1894_cov_27.386531_g697_i0~~NODE_750_length_1894_cov_27.386531_g697_i0.p2  ORF type:complete len:269 (+),score=68.14 NODE_750_length_1894_cov_27.386531_g697_i0:1011-1817(+)